jgi:hypothetical protein
MANLSIKTGTISRSMLVGNPGYVPPAFESIATLNASSGTSFVTFTSIPQTYKHLQLRGIARDTYSDGVPESTTITMRLNDNSSSVYLGHYLTANGSSVSAGGNSSANTSLDRMLSCAFGAGSANMFGVGIVDFPDYSSTTKNKTAYANTGGDVNTTDTKSNVWFSSGVFLSTDAITQIRIFAPISGFATGTMFSLYGIRG